MIQNIIFFLIFLLNQFFKQQPKSLLIFQTVTELLYSIIINPFSIVVCAAQAACPPGALFTVQLTHSKYGDLLKHITNILTSFWTRFCLHFLRVVWLKLHLFSSLIWHNKQMSAVQTVKFLGNVHRQRKQLWPKVSVIYCKIWMKMCPKPVRLKLADHAVQWHLSQWKC